MSQHTTYSERQFISFNPFSLTLFLIVAKMSLPKHSAPYWSNLPFQFFDIRALLSATVPGCQKIKKCRLDQYDHEHTDV